MGTRLATVGRAALVLLLLSGCTVSNPNFLGGELPLIPVHLPDTVAYDSWGFYGAVGSMLTYPRYPSGVRNQAVSAGVYRHTAPASPGLRYGLYPQRASFVYGALAFAGRYEADEIRAGINAYPYYGGGVYGVLRTYLWGNDRFSLTLDTGVNLFAELSEYHGRFDHYPAGSTAPPAVGSLGVGSLQGSLVPRFQINRHWSVEAAGTISLSSYYPLAYAQLSGAVGVSRRQFTLWSRAALHTGTLSYLGLPGWTVNSGLSYHFIRR